MMGFIIIIIFIINIIIINYQKLINSFDW